MGLGGYWYFSVVLGGSRWFLVILDESGWFLVFICCYCEFLVFLVGLGGSWWFLVVLIFFVGWNGQILTQDICNCSLSENQRYAVY